MKKIIKSIIKISAVFMFGYLFGSFMTNISNSCKKYDDDGFDSLNEDCWIDDYMDFDY